MAHRQVWSARCKSGYQWDTGKRTAFLKRIVWSECKQSTARGELICLDCRMLLDAAREQAHSNLVSVQTLTLAEVR